MIQAITFDLWNTIFHNRFYTEIRLKYLIELLKNNEIPYSLDKIKTAIKLAFNLPERDYEKNDHIYTDHRISNMLNILDLNLTNADKDLIKIKFEEAMLKDPPPLKFGVKQTLEELSLNYKIGLISNTGITPGRIIDRVFQKYEIFGFFQAKIYSDEIGHYKPHPILFKTALNELKCPPQNSVHIGDKLKTDIKGAKDFKMFTIWLNDSNSPRSEFIKPDYEIHEMPEVLQIVKELS
jgi:putative hydrolase of the HAD superfamily